MRVLTFAIVIAAFLALPAAAQFPINESFMNASAPGWIMGANTGSTFIPCLTSGNVSCGNDPGGNGWLRLTDTGNNEAGYANVSAGPSNTATNMAVVEILKVCAPSPPVPTMSTKRALSA